MNTPTNTQILQNLSKSLLNPDLRDENVKETIDKIHQVFQDVSGISGLEPNMFRQAAINTKYGKALGLNFAAQCLVDYKRTHQLLKGMKIAISEKKKDFPNEVIHVFYAGCGPYAPFMTLIAPLFSPAEIQFTLLDINSESIQFAKKLIEDLNMTEYVNDYHISDAITFSVPNAEKYHILYSETLDSMLYRESYVPILCNLLPQFQEEVSLIPENVQLKMSFICFDEQNERSEILEQVVFDAREAVSKSVELGQIPQAFDPVKVPIEKNRNIVGVIIDTEIKVYDSLKIKRFESQISNPMELKINSPEQVNSVVFTYQIEPEIQLWTTLE